MKRDNAIWPNKVWQLTWTIAVFAAVISLTDIAQAERRVPVERSEMQLSFAPVVKRTAPAVVNVYVRQKKVANRRTSPLFDDPFFRRFFGNRFGMPKRRMQNSLGSGVIVSEDGIVVTNFHVIKGGKDSEIKVALIDKREFSAKVILRDEQTDLAILKIETDDVRFPYLEFADSDGLEVGDLVLAIGNPFGVGQTVTSGIVSALARTRVGISDYQFFIQTDAAINPGNSGGALVGTDGRLVGINTAIFSKSGGSNGIGFAIPSNMARLVVNSALKGSKVVRPWFGAKLQALTSDIADSLGLDRPSGALVTSIHPGSPAAVAGLRTGDVIFAVDNYTVTEPRAFYYRFSTKGVGTDAKLEFMRNGKVRKANIELIAPPEVPRRNLQILDGPHPLNGVRVGNLSPAYAEELSIDDTTGVIIDDLAPGSYARRVVRLRRGDILMSINRQKIGNIRDLKKILRGRPNTWRLQIKRGNKVIRTVVRG